jgi:hypothetical protein
MELAQLRQQEGELTAANVQWIGNVSSHGSRLVHMGLKGSLAELPLTDLIEMTSVGGKTGLLVLFDEEGLVAGQLTFRGGRLVGALCGDLGAEKAFYALLALKAGSFDFDPAAPLDDEDCNLPTESLLMEGMRRLDEIHELRRALPAPARVRFLSGESRDPMEARVLGYLGPGARVLGDIVEGVLVGGGADEYDVLLALRRLTSRGVVHAELPLDDEGRTMGQAGPPQPELER